MGDRCPEGGHRAAAKGGGEGAVPVLHGGLNTGTLPHRKYYNVDAYEAEKAAKAAKRQKPLVRLLCICQLAIQCEAS